MYTLERFAWDRPWKKITFMWWVHGNEKSWILAINRLSEELSSWKLQLLSWELILILANTLAINLNRRFIDVDLNRSFWNTLENNSLRELKIWRDLGRIIKESDLLLDVHDTYDRSWSVPFIFTDDVSLVSLTPDDVKYCVKSYESTKQHEVFSTEMQEDWFVGTASERYMQWIWKKGMCLEAGTFTHPNPDVAYELMLNFLRNDWLIAGEVKRRQTKIQNLLYSPSSVVVRNWKDAITFAKNFKEFERIKKWETIWITDSWEELTAPYTGRIVFCLSKEWYMKTYGKYLPKSKNVWLRTSYNFYKEIE